MFEENKEYKFKPKEIKVYGPKINEAQQIDPNIIPKFPINKPVKYNEDLMKKAIKYGLVILMNYRGDEDKWKGGRERTIQPMVLGKNKNTQNVLVRGFHLEGWSVSQRAETKKVWRLFKTSNIISMTFTGNFFRLPPQGYKMNDRIMTERIIAKADFNEIRKNQNILLKGGKIQAEEETTLGKLGSNAVIGIELTNSNSKLDMKNPSKNQLINKSNFDPVKFSKDPSTLSMKFSIMRSMFGNKYLIIVGAIGTVDRQVKVYDGKTLLGNYKCIKSFLGSDLPNNKIVDGQSQFDLFVFNRKL
jgi:hypothetical protein